jgi:hypothetical protein
VPIGPQKSNSSIIWYIKWVIMSKKLGGKCISNKHKLTTTSNLRDFICEAFQNLITNPPK